MKNVTGKEIRPDAVFKERLAREEGAIIKDWGGKLPVALIYPNSYFIGMSNLGVQVIYGLLNSNSKVVCERVFNDEPALSMESRRPLTDFAVLAFSISYEPDYFNVKKILKASGIPLYAADRDESHPLVIAGGACITANPMPLSPFFDCLCIGEGEVVLPSMAPVLAEGIGGKRDQLLRKLATLPGVYVPLHPSAKPIARQWVKNIDDNPATSVVLTPDTELGDMYLMEVERGCGWGCRFCLVCTTFGPMRFRATEKLIEQARQGLKFRKRLGLVGPAVSDHPDIVNILKNLRGLGAELSFSSLRIGSLFPELWEEIAKSGVQTVTLAPEAGTRLRQVVKKGVTEEQILAAADTASRLGVKQLKLYFMVGLPTETDEDVEAIAELALKAKSIIERRRSRTRLMINISSFVPKAGTPFQWLPMAPIKVLNRRLSSLKKRLAPRGIDASYDSPAWSELQAVLARGDASLAPLLAGMEKLSLPAWRQAVKSSGIDVDFYAHQRWPSDQPLPWSVIDLGVGPEHLKRELDKALA